MNDNQSISQTGNAGGKELPAGTRLEEFVIERVLGSGGFGITYLARDTSLNRQVVIKENLPSQFAHRDTTSLTVRPGPGREDQDNFQWSLENFSREAEMLASLRHPGIVSVLRRFQAFGTAYFVMPFVEGVPFDELIEERHHKNNPFSEEELRGMLERVLAALDHLHQRGIYHRDIKPANILISNDGIPVLIDFGSARQRLSERSMTVVESAGYTPFEQLESRGNVGPWSDLYALGGTVEKALTGQTPTKAMDRMRRDPRTPLEIRPELFEKYSSVFLCSIDKAIRVEEADRWQDAGEWLAALREPAELNVAAAHLPPTRMPWCDPLHTPLTAMAQSAAPKRKNNLLPWIIAACFLLGLYALVKTISGSKDENHPATQVDDSSLQQEQEKAFAEQASDAETKSNEEDARNRQAEILAANAERERRDLQAMQQTNEVLENAKAIEKEKLDRKRQEINVIIDSSPTNATRDKPYVNGLGMQFVPVNLTEESNPKQLLFSIWETRRKDYSVYVLQNTNIDDDWNDPGFPQDDQHPVVYVSWKDAVSFCAWLTKTERTEGRIGIADQYRIPTDFEWSCAVGISMMEDASKTPAQNHYQKIPIYPWGGEWPPSSKAGNYDSFSSNSLYTDLYDRTSPVGFFRKNSYGIYDLGGNVWEWCNDTMWDGSKSRIMRGGSWDDNSQEELSSGYRKDYSPSSRNNNSGFRCVLDLSGNNGK